MTRPTVEEFKNYFADYFRFSPYNVWEKTCYDKDEIVSYNAKQYKSDMNFNISTPGDDMWFDYLVDTWENGVEYNVDAVVKSEGIYYQALQENKNVEVTDTEYWKELTIPEVQSIYGDAWIELTEEQEDVPEFVQPIVYSKNSLVFYLKKPNYAWGIYKSLSDNNFYEPSDEERWELTSIKPSTFIKDSDIETAMDQASTVCVEGKIGDPKDYFIAFMYMTAHFLIIDWKMKNTGINASGTSGILIGRTVGDMTTHYSVSPIIQKYPEYEIYYKTLEGQKAMSIILRWNVAPLIYVDGSFTDY